MAGLLLNWGCGKAVDIMRKPEALFPLGLVLRISRGGRWIGKSAVARSSNVSIAEFAFGREAMALFLKFLVNSL
jgi:hypothetical protein